MDQSFIVATELGAVQEYDPCELREQGESAKYAGEAFAKQAVQECVPSEWKVQGKSEESFCEALAKYAVQEYAHSGWKEQGESEESFGEAFAMHAVQEYGCSTCCLGLVWAAVRGHLLPLPDRRPLGAGQRREVERGGLPRALLAPRTVAAGWFVVEP